MIKKGNNLFLNGKSEEAIKYYNKVITINRDNEIAWHNKGLVLFYLKRYKDAIKCYNIALRIKPEYKNALKNKKIALEKIEGELNDNQNDVEGIKIRINKLKLKVGENLLDDIKKLLQNNKLYDANLMLTEIEKKYEKINQISDQISIINNKIRILTNKLVDGEISSSAFEKARDDLEYRKKEIEEELWKLRNKLFKDDYEKPF